MRGCGGSKSIFYKDIGHLKCPLIHISTGFSTVSEIFCAGTGNRTLICTLARYRSTTKLYPPSSARADFGGQCPQSSQRQISTNDYTRSLDSHKAHPPSVLPEGLEPPIAVPKTAVISISPRERFGNHTLDSRIYNA